MRGPLRRARSGARARSAPRGSTRDEPEESQGKKISGACLAALLFAAVGCGDGIDCPADLGLELVSPAADGPIGLADDRSGRPGVQVDVELHSVLQAGEPAELTVRGGDGGEELHQALANADGDLVFPLVTLPTGDVALSVHAESRRCGEDTFITALSVLGPACALGLAEEPIQTDDYGIDVLNLAADSDSGAPGFQAHVEVASEEGFEVEVFTIYGETETSAGITVADGGQAVLPITLVQGDIALRAECRSRESSDAATTLPHGYFVDTVAPVCGLASPADGAVIDPGLDESADPGIQVTLRGQVDGSDVSGEPTSFSAGGSSVPGSAVDETGAASAQVSFTASGTIDIGFSASDHAENECSVVASVTVDLSDLSVAFDQPVAGGVVGPADGAAAAGSLDLDVCGTVSEPPDAVSLVVDGGAPIAAVVAGSTFCAPVSLAESPPAHQLSAVATVGARQASAEVDLVVDLTAPDALGGLTATGVDREALEVAFVAPDDAASGVASYEIKIATRPFTESNFESIGTTLPAPAPAAPGTPQSLLVEGQRPGTRYHVAGVAIDRAGNRSPVAGDGPIVLRLDATGAIAAGDNSGRLGAALAAGLLDGDAYTDLAVGAPLDGAADSGRVRIYTGGAGGMGGPPARTLSGPTGARFGNALAVLDWNDDGEMDLAVGAPGAAGGSGRVYVYLGPVTGGAADAVISVAPASTVLDGGAIGSSLAAADFDGDGTGDLVIGAPGAAGGDGAAVVLFGGATGAIALDETDPSGPAGYLVAEPGAAAGGGFGARVFGLGPTENALDGDDDIGLAYDDEPFVFVLRGRARPAAGLAPLPFDGARDFRLDDDSADATTGFGARMAAVGDQDGDGTADLAVGAWLEGRGRVYLVRGGLTGTRQTSSTAVRSTIVAGSGVSHLGAAIADTHATGAADLDMDGRPDLVLAADASRLRLYVFFGGAVPTGRVDLDLAPYQEPAPAGFLGSVPGGLLPANLIWAGDVDGDGLDDLALADPGASAFAVYWDAP